MNKKFEANYTDDGTGFPEAIDGEHIREEIDNEIIKEIQEDLKSIEEMRMSDIPETPTKVKGLRHAVAKNADAKRKHKIKLQTQARKAQRGK